MWGGHEANDDGQAMVFVPLMALGGKLKWPTRFLKRAD